MKRVILAASILVMAAIALWSQPKVAVLDAIIPQNMDPSVVVPVTEKIVERLVVSGRFTVLDRANIESVLKEREFQVSGMVSDQDVVTAGKYLGADFVVVAKVQKVGDTYFISAKMIAIKTGVIANQTSAQGEGKLSELISLAEQVGEILSGGAVLAQSAAGGTKDISKKDGGIEDKKSARTKVPQNRGGSRNAFLAGLSSQAILYELKGTDSGGGGTWTETYTYFTGDLAYSTKYLSLGFSVAVPLSATYEDVTYTTFVSTYSGELSDRDTFLALIIAGQYPFSLGKFSVFPIIGLEYDINLGVKDSTGASVTMTDTYKTFWNRLFVTGGVGADIGLGGDFFLRPQIVFGWKPFSTDYDDANISYGKGTLSFTDVVATEVTAKLSLLAGFKL